MTSRAVTASIAHQSLADIGYQDCNEHGEKPYRWMGPPKCPRCSALKNPNLLPRSFVRELPPIGESKNNASQKRGGWATGNKRTGMLTDAQVIELRDRNWIKGETLKPLAREFETTPTTIHHAVKGLLAYAHIEYMPDTTKRPTQKRANVRKFTPEEVRTIRRRNTSGESYEVLAREYDRARDTIANICKRHTWKNV